MMNIIIICSNIELFIQIEKKWKRNHSKNLLKKTNNLFLFVVLERRRLWKEKVPPIFFFSPPGRTKKNIQWTKFICNEFFIRDTKVIYLRLLYQLHNAVKLYKKNFVLHWNNSIYIFIYLVYNKQLERWRLFVLTHLHYLSFLKSI